MGIGVSIFLFAVGAILAWGVDVDSARNVNVDTIGVILMAVAAVGFVLSLVFWSSVSPFSRRERTVTTGPGGTRREERVIEERELV